MPVPIMELQDWPQKYSITRISKMNNNLWWVYFSNILVFVRYEITKKELVPFSGAKRLVKYITNISKIIKILLCIKDANLLIVSISICKTYCYTHLQLNSVIAKSYGTNGFTSLSPLCLYICTSMCMLLFIEFDSLY